VGGLEGEISNRLWLEPSLGQAEQNENMFKICSPYSKSKGSFAKPLAKTKFKGLL
jgi:hypothetical protein